MKELVGTWKLVSMKHTTSDGKVFFPMGPDAIGQLMYSSDGFMSVSIMIPNRKRFTSNGLFDGMDHEKKEAMESFMAYCGRYRVEGNKIIHVVEMSLFPNWLGNEETRFFEIDKDTLILTTPPFTSKGREEIGQITWKRAK